MDLLQEYLSLAEDVVSFCEYDKKSVAERNNKVTRMRNIAILIEKDHAEHTDAFCKLLFCDHKDICLRVAHHILEVMNCEQTYRKAALRIIRRKAKTDKTANGFGEKMWLKQWYQLHPKDRWII